MLETSRVTQAGSEPRIPDKPLETYHPETTHLTATRSCEACAAFTRVAARTLAPSPIRDLLHRRLQPFRHLHDCSGCFRLERSPGGTCTHWKAPPSHGAHVRRTLRIALCKVLCVKFSYAAWRRWVFLCSLRSLMLR